VSGKVGRRDALNQAPNKFGRREVLVAGQEDRSDVCEVLPNSSQSSFFHSDTSLGSSSNVFGSVVIPRLQRKRSPAAMGSPDEGNQPKTLSG
jgi:hypothetical protein